MNNESPWSAYGRQDKAERPALGETPDPTFGAAREAMRTHDQLKQYLARTLQEYNEIRAGRTGYTRIVAEALKPPPGPESIEETLRRLSVTSACRHRNGRRPSSRP